MSKVRRPAYVKIFKAFGIKAECYTYCTTVYSCKVLRLINYNLNLKTFFMKKIYFLFIALAIGATAETSAQNWVLNQVIVGSGGSFSNPDDHVNLASFNPDNGLTTDFGSVLTHSVQDIIIKDQFAYVAAQDSIAKYELDSYERIAIVEAVGVNRLLVTDEEIIASFQFPVTENFVKVYSQDNLTFISSIGAVSGESAGLLQVNQLIYVAVNGGWAGTTGSIAIIQLSDYSLVDEIDLGMAGKSIMDLFYYDDKIMSLSTTAWGDSTAYISTMNSIGSHFDSYLIPQTIGSFVGVRDNTLYTVMNSGIGSINLSDFAVMETAVIEAPALTIACAKLDTINDEFYITKTDYFSMGEGSIYSIDGNETGSFDTYISPDAIAFDYRDNTDIVENQIVNSLVYPVPASQFINIQSNMNSVESYTIIDISGRTVIESNNNYSSGDLSIDIRGLEKGVYIIRLIGNNELSTSRFIKN